MNQFFEIFKWLLAISFFVALLLFTNQRQHAQNMYLKKIIIEESNDNFINQKIVLDFLQDNAVYFDSILPNNYSKEDLENLLISHPSIKDVEVFGSQKGDVNILIEQKQAVVRLKGNAGDYYLDEFGKRMELCSNYTPNLAVVTGDFTVNDHISIFQFISHINKSDFWRSQITQVHFDQGEVFLIPRIGSHKVNVGSFSNIIDKLNNLYHFYKVVMPHKGWQAYSDINLSFENQIVCLKNIEK